MTCVEALPLLHAHLDGELDLRGALDIEQHLESCHGCSVEYRKLELLRAEIAGVDLDFASDTVMQRLHGSIERQGGFERPARWSIDWRLPAFVAAAAAVVVLAVFLPGRITTKGDLGDRGLIDSHLRSLQAGHLFDIPSSDRHTVKPWFQGKIEFAPTVPDLSEKGFVLAGGRLDVIDARKVAVIVYQRRDHIINLWISQGSAAGREPTLGELNGFHLIRWSMGGMTFRAVSDVDVRELRTFVDAYRGQ